MDTVVKFSRTLGEQPCVHPTARVKDTSFGAWCEVQERTKLTETVMGDYSYICGDGEVIYTDIGKFCSIASHVRINPGNHPLDRAALHHFTYRSEMFELGEDDPDFFDWRRQSKVTIGNDVWIGHGVTVMPGVSIGDGAAIGSGAVVTRDVEAFTVVVDGPAKALRKRVDDECVAGLQAARRRRMSPATQRDRRDHIRQPAPAARIKQ